MALELSDADREVLKGPLCQALFRLQRSQDRSGAWESIPDEALIEPYIVTKVQKREIPLIGDPDPDILWRVEQLYQAISMEVERRTGVPCGHILNIHHEGWGRIVILAGKLVAVSAYVRELHRFGYENLVQLEQKCMKLVEEGVATIQKYPEVAAA